jgi:hypothetical protein
MSKATGASKTTTLPGSTRNRGRFTKERIAKARLKPVIRINGKRFRSPHSAAKYTGLHHNFLRKHKERSPLLGGRDMQVRPITDGLGRVLEYTAEKSLDELLEAVAQLSTSPTIPGYVTYEDAPEVAGASLDAVKRLKKHGCKRFGIKKFKEKRVLGKDTQGRVRYRRLLPTAPLSRYRQCREKAVVAKEKITVAQAAEYLDVCKASVLVWIRQGILPKEPGQLVPGGVNGDIQEGFLLDRKEVERLKKKRDKGPQPFVDQQGTWYPESHAEEKYPHAKGYMLRRYRNKPCPQLNGEVLRAQQIPWPDGMNPNRFERPWAYLEADLKRLTRPGRPGPKLTSQEIDAAKLRHHYPIPVASDITGVPRSELYRMAKMQLDGAPASKATADLSEGPGEVPFRFERIQNPDAQHSRYKTIKVVSKASADEYATARGRMATSRGATPAEGQVLPGVDTPKQPGGSPEKKAGQGGRPRLAQTEVVMKFCYEDYVGTTLKLATIRAKAKQRFGDRAPKEAAHVRIYAARYAKRYGLPLERPQQQSRT